MKIYKTDSLHRHVILDKGGSRNSNTPTQHEFDLPNNHTYNEKGELIRERDLGKLDLDFSCKLTGIEPVERVEDFLDYQFEHSEDKLKFLKHINTGVIINSYRISRSPARQQILIDWIKEKKKQLEGQQSKGKHHRKIKWNGTQKNLAELFLELEKKGWIEKIETGYRAKVCESIEAIFDLSETKKSKETNSLKSFIEIMTPFFDNVTKETSYPKVFTERYKKQFENIKTAKKTT